MKFLKDKIIALALEHDLTQSQVQDIFNSQFKFTAKVMAEDSIKDVSERRSVKIKGIGTFKFNKRQANKVNELHEYRKKGVVTTTAEN
jgi:nucleoid DNA-binding protein